MKTMKCLSSLVILLALLISMLTAYAQDSPEYELNFVYNGQNLSFGEFSKEAPGGLYRVEVISLSGKVLETSEFDITSGESSQMLMVIPYSEEGILLNVYNENGTLMFYTDISQYAGEKYRNVSAEEKEIKIQNIVSSKMNETQMKEVEKRYEETKKWFTVLLIAAVLIVGAMVFYVWGYKMPRE